MNTNLKVMRVFKEKARLARVLTALLLLVAGVGQTWAQSVTISPETGNLIAALTYANETGYENGWSALWRHEQLPMNFTVADDSGLTDGGEISNPACNLSVYNGNIALMGGVSGDVYCVLSLPKGYRFKGYKMVLLNNLNRKEVNNMRMGYRLNDYGNYTSTTRDVTKIMYETDKTYDISNYITRGHYDDNAAEYSMNGAASNNTNKNDTREYVIERDGMEGEWSNQLYFRLNHTNTNEDAYYAVTIKSFTVYFTSEGDFSADVTPTNAGVARSLVMSPFSTNKIDIGAVQTTTKNGAEYYAYTYSNVKDIQAYNYIYQEDAVTEDGRPMDVAETKKIYPLTIGNKQYFAFGNGTYYVESPTQVYSQTGIAAPIGFRIVGANFKAQWANATSGTSTTKTGYTITYTNRGRTYYLNDQLQYSTTFFYWDIDEHGNICKGNRFLSCYGEGNNRYLTWSSNPDAQWNLRRGQVNGSTAYYVYYLSDGGNYYFLLSTLYNDEYPNVTRDATTNRVTSAEQETSEDIPAYTPGAYTLEVYDKTGKEVAGSVSVTGSANAGQTIDLTGYNNDAVKFKISGLATGRQALVDVSILMQALNPYIDQMNIVCHDAEDQLSLSMPFTVENFMVMGGKFKFYVPVDYSNQNLRFTFNDLYSTYGDNTYYTGTSLQKNGVARYSFVTSDYFTSVNGNGNDGLYAAAYSPDASYVDKVWTAKVGNNRFKFNNAENLGNSSTNLNADYLKEYPFSVATYLNTDDPDGVNGKGEFNEMILNTAETSSGVYYVFTADETRYNIAPSKAWQHRYYAFYRVDIELEARTYYPKFTWTKVYDKTCYNKDGALSEEPMWGLKLETVATEGSSTAVKGYLTVEQIEDAINAALGQDGCPESADQILYIDGSELYSIVAKDGHLQSDLKKLLAPNALVYLPANTTSTLDNFAYQVTGGGFRAGKDIVLTDNRPFYAPYDIQVDVDNVAKYERKITFTGYEKQKKYATIIMPYELKIDDSGLHTNTDGTTFNLHQMKPESVLQLQQPEDKIYYAYFPEVANLTKTSANTPYLVVLDENSVQEDSNTSFVVSQTGTHIEASTGMNTDYTFDGETATGKAKAGTAAGVDWKFTHKGSFAGRRVPREENIFYFAQDHFVCSKDLVSSISGVNMAPFRSYYQPETSNVNSVSVLNIVLGDEQGGVLDAIETLRDSGLDMSIRAGRGTLTIDAAADSNVSITGINGVSRYNMTVGAGESRTVSLPSGVYVVNGVKIVVK